MSDEDKFNRLLRSAQRFTAYRERAPAEVGEKLREWNASEKDVEAILKDLQSNGFVDEERFARAFFNDKFRFNRWGKQKILSAIRRFRLSEDALIVAEESISGDQYLETLRELMGSKWDKTKETDVYKKKTKVANFLLQRGFEAGLIWEELRDFSDES